MQEEHWDIVITSKRKWYQLNLNEVFHYKDLIILLVKRNLTAQYKQTILGPLWFVITPLVSTVISTMVFGNIAGIASDGVPYFLFYLVGYTLWNYFANCVSQTASTFTSNVAIMGKVYFPRLTMPISSVIYAAINMIIVFSLSLLIILYYGIHGYDMRPSLSLLLIPIFMIQTAVLGLAVGIIVSSLTTKYRDLSILVGFGLQLWMYLTPVVYPISEVSGTLRTLILINPMSAVIQNYKFALLGSGCFLWSEWIVSIVVTIILFLLGVLLFNKVEKTFMDTV